jgi:hypothetical protein
MTDTPSSNETQKPTSPAPTPQQQQQQQQGDANKQTNDKPAGQPQQK